MKNAIVKFCNNRLLSMPGMLIAVLAAILPFHKKENCRPVNLYSPNSATRAMTRFTMTIL